MERPHGVILLSVMISALLGLLAGFLGGRLAAPPARETGEVLRAQHFQLVDQAGQSRGRLGVDEHGAARLTLFGPDGPLPRVSLAAHPQRGAELELGDDRRQSAVVLKADQDARTIALYQEGKLRLGLAVQKNGEAAVNLYDKDNRLITLGLTNQGDPHLTFYGEGQRAALEVVSKKNGDRSLNLVGKNGTPRVVLGLKNDNKAALGLFDRQGKTRAALMDEPSLILLKEGKPVRTLP
jgi:ribosomal protein S18 acetylase RimI-like enzyme